MAALTADPNALRQRGGEDGEGSGGWWSLKVVAVVLAAAGVSVEGDGDVNGGVGVMVWHGDAATMAILASSSEVPSVLEFLQRRKLEAKKEVAASEFSHLNHSLSHRPVSVKPDISKPDISKASSAGGKLHILKPSCERNGITPTPKESLSPTSGSKVPNSPLTGESNLLIVKASAD
ncbi:hypothetical protein Tco_0907825 [Tanacetum coccineum]|uniref:Uncharacterized protein n=1 Tax=Tanacetum coccineum TaxID=301880 RepID=A0ABQ5CLJ2_9ASTR